MGSTQAKQPRVAWPAIVLGIAAAGVYGVLVAKTLLHGQTFFAEVEALVRSWWYVTGAVPPYTATDATWTMPLYLYQLGGWQDVAGIGYIPARALSIGLGVIDGVLLFLICKRVTANATASAGAVFVFLATPATAFYFATATPAATIAALHLAAIWLIVAHMGRPRLWASAAMGLLCTALYFYRQDMVLAVVVLAPLYVIALGRKRWLHGAVLLLVLAASSATILGVFPERLAHDAARLPVLYPLLQRAGLIAPDYLLIDRGTLSATTMDLAPGRLHGLDLLEAFILPYAGTILVALAVFAVAGRGLRVLWIAPLYFFWLAATHILGSAGFCGRCIADYAPYFAGVGALAAGFTFALLGRAARATGVPTAVAVMIAALIAVGLNTFAPLLAPEAAWRMFPAGMMAETSRIDERKEIESFARWISGMVPQPEPILAIHSLGRTQLPSLPFAILLSGHLMPAQSFDPAATHRVINPKLNGTAREAVQAAVENESLWTDDTMRRWVERDYDVILFQDDDRLAALRATITQRFDLVATATYRGANISLFRRRSAQ